LYRLIVICIAVVLISGACNSASFISTALDGAWEWQNPRPQGNYLWSTSFADPMVGWAVGDRGTILKTTNGGVSWAPQISGTVQPITHVQFLDSSVGYASCIGGIVLKTVNGGAKWRPQKVGPADFYWVHFNDAGNGWAVGWDSGEPDTAPGVYRTTDGGEHWARISDSQFYDIHFVDSTHGWAIDYNGIYRTTDGGETWNVPDPNPTSVYAIEMLDLSTGWAVGDYGLIYKTIDGGDSWNLVPNYEAVTLWAVSFADANHGWAVGDYGLIMQTSDGGDTWTSQYVTGQPSVFGVFAADANSVSAVGANGLIALTQDGAYWQVMSSGNYDGLIAAQFIDSSSGWAVGQYGAILKTTDGGLSWSKRESYTTDEIMDLSFATSNTGWVVGGSNSADTPRYLILKSINGGTDWATQKVGTGHTLYGVSFADASTGCAVGGKADDPVGTSVIMRTSTAGATWWTVLSSAGQPFYGVQMVDQTTAYAVGGLGKLAKSIDGGENWSVTTINSDYWLSSVHFINPSTGWAVGYDYARRRGIILKTTNGGLNWDVRRLDTDTWLNSVFFIDALNGMAVGANGTFVATADGGLNWETKESGADASLRDIKFVGSEVGWIVGDYGTILRTTTGMRPWCGLMKTRPNGTPVDLGHVVVTARENDYVYVQHPETYSAIRVETSDPSIGVGDFIYVHGVVGATGLERVIGPVTWIEKLCGGWGDLAPLASNAPNLGGNLLGSGTTYQPGIPGMQGANPVGLLVKIWGKVTEKNAAENYMMIDDASGIPIKVDTRHLQFVPSVGQRVFVTGIFSIYGTVETAKRMVTPRSDQDIAPMIW